MGGLSHPFLLKCKSGNGSVKQRNKKGFTLAELLVVVAIVAILVAVGIPIFLAQRRKANIAVNQANIRSAKAAAEMELYMGKTYDVYWGGSEFTTAYFCYDVEDGKITKSIFGKPGIVNNEYKEGNEMAKDVIKPKGGKPTLKPDEKWKQIIVFVGNPELTSSTGKSGAPLQTAPYYSDDFQIGMSKDRWGTINWFGPNPGS